VVESRLELLLQRAAAVPNGPGEHIALDRDSDGELDGDE